MLLLLKTLYGTKDAGRLWYVDIDGFLKSKGFKANKADNCFYTLGIDEFNYVLLLLYVDDMQQQLLCVNSMSRSLLRNIVAPFWVN